MHSLYRQLLHEFELETFGMRGMKDEEDMHGFFHYHQGDKAFFLHANKYSVVEYPKIVGYGNDGRGVRESIKQNSDMN